MELSKIVYLQKSCLFWSFYVFITFSNFGVSGQTVLPYRRVLDPETGYILEWRVNREENTILFNIGTRASRDLSVVFGLNTKRQLEGADVVVFGISQNGSAYIHDMSGVRNNTLQYDVQQNWEIISAQRSPGGQTQVSISRKLDTCDVDEDVVIPPDLIYVVWGYMDSENLNQRENNSIDSLNFSLGNNSLPVYILDRELPPLSSSVQTWRFARKFHMPPGRHTSYWCSIQRGPRLRRKNHIIGFSAYFKDAISRSHVHHVNVFRCIAPPDVDPVSVFEPFVNHPGQACYFNEEAENPPLPVVPFCREVIYLWGVGGYDAQLPENVGFPLGEESTEYFMMETHYDNFDMTPNLVVQNGVDFRYSQKLRENDGGMAFIGYGVVNNLRTENVFAVPPHSTNFTIAGQCSPECTRKMLPQSGLEVVAVTLHGHIATRKMRLRHYRDNQQLAMIQTDENYDFNFQQMRLLTLPVTLMPGDHLVAECAYDNLWKNGSTVSGLATRDEMCNAFIYTNKRIPYMYCSSEYPSSKVLSLFGVRNMTWDLDLYERVVTSSSTPSHVGLPFSQVVDLLSYNWTAEQRSNLQMEMQFSEHIASCPTVSEIAQSIQQSATGASLSTNDGLPSVVYPRNVTPIFQNSSRYCNNQSQQPVISLANNTKK